ncbi:unnamed protein product [Periconia digitata]|uniref:Chitin-binding type-1 domain-containing protein n=1 Tax=Periconia digitata TaxID=1303443 RepID=A0A9W4XIF3_9PLEO|nr:unnamed protein product [Periconia digitata]
MRFGFLVLAALPAVYALETGKTYTTLEVSKDGSCGGSTGYTCLGSSFGSCCNKDGWCGSSKDCCGTGCNPLFGSCSSLASSSTKQPTSLSTLLTSTRTSSTAPSSLSSSAPTSAPQSCEPVTLTVPSCAFTPTITITGQGSASTIIQTTTLTLAGNNATAVITSTIVDKTTVTIPATITLSGQDIPVPTTTTTTTTVTLPGDESVITVTVPGETPAPITSTLTATTTTSLTIPGDEISITVTVPGETPSPIISTITITATTAVTLPGEDIPITITIPGETPAPVTRLTTVTLPGDDISITVTIPGETPAPITSTVTSTTTIASCAPPNPSVTQAVVNPGFETSEAWSLNGGMGAFQYVNGNQNSGSRALMFSTSLPFDQMYSLSQTVTLYPGAVYRLNYYAKSNVSNNCVVRATLGSTSIVAANSVLGTSYALRTGVYYPVAGVTSAVLTIVGSCAQASGQVRSVFFDDVTLTIEGFYTPSG